MTRICSVSLVLSCLLAAVAKPQEIGKDQVVAFDKETARLLPAQKLLGILVHDKQESYETINARALAMRHARYFVYQSGQESTLAALYRERLQTQGVMPIELPRESQRRRCNPKGEQLSLK